MELPVLLVVLLLGVLLWRRRAGPGDSAPGSARRSARRRASSADQPFEAVSVCPGGDACIAALELEGQRFLVREAPRLPLTACDRANCGCQFVGFPDRREGGDRRAALMALDRDFATKALPERNRGRRRGDR